MRLEIETLQGHLKHVDLMVSFSTVAVSLAAPTREEPLVEDSWNLKATVAQACRMMTQAVHWALVAVIYAIGRTRGSMSAQACRPAEEAPTGIPLGHVHLPGEPRSAPS